MRRVLGIAEAATHGEFLHVHFGWLHVHFAASLANMRLHAHSIKVSNHCLHARLVAITDYKSSIYNNS